MELTPGGHPFWRAGQAEPLPGDEDIFPEDVVVNRTLRLLFQVKNVYQTQASLVHVMTGATVRVPPRHYDAWVDFKDLHSAGTGTSRRPSRPIIMMAELSQGTYLPGSVGGSRIAGGWT